MPKRSASSTTITVAFGTSTPTSMTVVATSTSTSPDRKRSMTASFSAAGTRPWSSSTRRPASAPSSPVSRSKVSWAEAASSFSDSSMSGHTT